MRKAFQLIIPAILLLVVAGSHYSSKVAFGIANLGGLWPEKRTGRRRLSYDQE
jgi:hypothetical protein